MKRYAPYILIVIIMLVGLFSPTAAKADQAAYNICAAPFRASINPSYSEATIAGFCQAALLAPASATPTAKGNTLYENLNSCGVIISGTLAGCFIQIVYYIVYGLSSFLLIVAARFFDILIALTLSSTLYGPFIAKAWAIVRDLSNIFFILVLLYIAIKIILDLGGSEVKKMIARVIIAALLINFSMFMTGVVVDASNILALIFYNKITVTVLKKDGTTADINYVPTLSPVKSGVQDKDIAGALVSRFDPTTLMTQEFFDKVKKTTYEFSAVGFAAYVGGGALVGSWVPIVGTAIGAGVGAVGYFLGSGTTAIPVPLILGIIVISGGIMAFAAYAFFIAGLAFLSRIIELWILIIFSPFAFMSSSIPLLEGVPYIGWNDWRYRLLKVSFMAPIFMLFMYLIVKIIEADPIGSLTDRNYAQQGWMESLLLLVIPAILILVLLIKATKFAKEGSGALGDIMIKGAKMATGVALGVATGGAALAFSAGAGRLAASAASSERLNEKAKQKGIGGATARMALRTADYGKGASFDIRKIPGVAALAKSGGINLESTKAIGLGSQEGGYAKRRTDKVKRNNDRADQLKVREDEKLKQDLNKTEGDLQGLLSANAHIIETLDKTIEKKRQEVADANNKLNAARGTPAEAAARTVLTDANRKLDIAKEDKKDFRTGGTYAMTDSAGITTMSPGTGVDIDALEEQKKDQAQSIKTENILRKQAFANRLEGKDSKILFWRKTKANREAANKIRTDAKLDSGTKT